MERVICANCGLNNTTIIFKKGIFEKGGPVIKFNNVICNNCGLTYRNPRETVAELNGIYKNIYLEKRHMLKDEKAVEAFISTLDPKNKGEQIYDFLKDFLNQNSEILDVGSGLGLIGGFLYQKFGYKTRGIEPSKLSAKASEKKYGMPVFRGTFDAFLESQSVLKKFDCIILHHVFEHFSEPIKKLKELQSILRERGVLYIEVPNILDFKKPITQFFDFLHLYNYSPRTLSQVLKKGGFKVIRWNREKRFRIQIVAALETNSFSKVFEIYENDNNEAARIMAYCRRQYLKEIFSHAFKTLRLLRDKITIIN